MAELNYRGYDRAALDRQLNMRARWPEHPRYFATWREASQATRQRPGARLDLAYGDSDGQRLDLFAPEDARGVPLLAFIHGGYWQGLDKQDFSYLADPFIEAGIAFASLNYDLAPKVSIEAIVGQIRAALAWLYRTASDQGIDGDRMVVSGHSAGGHLTAMAMATDWPALFDLPADLLKGGCSISGVYDLEPIRLSYHQDVVALDPGMVERVGPIRQIPSRAAPLLCAVGSEETEEFLLQQDEFLAAWRAAGHPGEGFRLEGRNHFTAVDALGEPGHPLFKATCRLVRGGP